jgi:hypothetical protein
MRLMIMVAIIGLCATHPARAQGGMQGEPSASAETLDDAECERRGQPKIGMTAPQAMQTCWGKPVRTIANVTHDSLEEQLIYANGRVLKFRNGLLFAILEKRVRARKKAM